MRMRCPGLVAVTIAAATFTLGGCGGVLYASGVNSASRKLAEAKELGAAQLAPYEYTYADANLNQAMSEASEGDYSDATTFAEVAETYATKAIELTKEAQRGAGR
jgi:hypothetical protein